MTSKALMPRALVVPSAMLALLCLIASTTSAISPPPGYEAIPELSDEFDGTALDQFKWSTNQSVVGWPGRRPGLFDANNVIVSGGFLQLWAKAAHPNLTAVWDTWKTIEHCTAKQKVGCVFDIEADPDEHHDLATEQPELAHKLLERLQTLDATLFDPPRGEPDTDGACTQAERNEGDWGPWL